MVDVRRRPTLAKGRPATTLSLTLLEQLSEILFPYRGQRVRAVTRGLAAERDDDGAAVRHAPDLLFQNPQLGRVDQVVRRVDGQQRRRDFLQPRPGIVVVRGLQRIENV